MPTDPTGTLVVVTGSRDYKDWREVYLALDECRRDGRTVFVMHGACPTGADAFAASWADCIPEQPQLPMPAPWERRNKAGKRLGKLAGPLRNSVMVLIARLFRWCGWRVVCHAFGLQQSRGGTADMVRKLEAAGFEVARHE